METNEIRVGNIFIGYDDKPFVWGLKEFSFIEPDVAISIDEIIKSPVELDEEILIKVGFEKLCNEFSYKGTCFEKYKKEFFYSAGEGLKLSKDIKYIHQLQNLYFALTGTELDTSKLL